MKIISHRGNLYGPDHITENTPDSILEAIKLGFDVEVDVWLYNNKFFLGHDEPQYETDILFLKNKNIWCHTKNKEAFEELCNSDCHYFWHDSDKFTITSKGIHWCYPNNYSKHGITVLKDRYTDINNIKCLGICTDFPIHYLKYFIKDKS
jgi:hypothetical protein